MKKNTSTALICRPFFGTNLITCNYTIKFIQNETVERETWREAARWSMRRIDICIRPKASSPAFRKPFDGSQRMDEKLFCLIVSTSVSHDDDRNIRLWWIFQPKFTFSFHFILILFSQIFNQIVPYLKWAQSERVFLFFFGFMPSIVLLHLFAVILFISSDITWRFLFVIIHFKRSLDVAIPHNIT